MKNVMVDPSAKHDFIKDRARKKDLKNIDDLFQHLNKLKENGVLDLWMDRYGKQYGYKRHDLKESIELKIDSLLETVAVATSVGAPIAPMVNTKAAKDLTIKNQSPYSTEKTHQDPGAEKRKK
jgi:hypothetical protein